MHARTRLLKRLAECETLLANYGVDYWPSWLRHGADLVAAGDSRGLDHLRQGYGGMGSFNDLVISPLNRHRGGEEELRAADKRLDRLRSEIYQLLNTVRADGHTK
jgi:hypothetical protein